MSLLGHIPSYASPHRCRQIALSMLLSLVWLNGNFAAAQDPPPAKPVNVAPAAEIRVSSAHRDSYLGKFVADGAIPAAMSHGDVGRAWCA